MNPEILRAIRKMIFLREFGGRTPAWDGRNDLINQEKKGYTDYSGLFGGNLLGADALWPETVKPQGVPGYHDAPVMGLFQYSKEF